MFFLLLPHSENVTVFAQGKGFKGDRQNMSFASPSGREGLNRKLFGSARSRLFASYAPCVKARNQKRNI